jgi:type II secretion system protein H
MFTDRKGFTLIEVIIVVVIMGAAIGLAVPSIGKSLGKMKLKSAVRKFSAVLRYTRQMAISRKKEYTVTILSNKDDAVFQYKYIKVERKGNKKDAFSDDEEIEASESRVTNFTDKNIQKKKRVIDLGKIQISYQQKDREGEYQEGGSGEIIFYPKGESNGGRVIFSMEGVKLAFKVDIDPVIGRVKVKQKNEEE